jgi:PQQ-dependent catabolism-associated CXXCW motif protein
MRSSGILRSLPAAALLCAVPLLSMVNAQELPAGVDPATGYRMDHYRAPTPDTLPGGKIADYAMVKTATEDGSYRLIDVYAGGVKADPTTGDWTIVEKREHIPTSIWLPGPGFGKLDAAQEAYFRRNLEAVSNGDKARGLLFYCMSDCWQSWNAARRAIEWGYTNVAWYPLGTDGWREHGGAFVMVKPVNFLGSGS